MEHTYDFVQAFKSAITAVENGESIRSYVVPKLMADTAAGEHAISCTVLNDVLHDDPPVRVVVLLELQHHLDAEIIKRDLNEQRVRPFSNGSQSVNWDSRNCVRCKHTGQASGKTTCDIENELTIAYFDDGTVSADVASRMNYQDGVYSWQCGEFEERAAIISADLLNDESV